MKNIKLILTILFAVSATGVGYFGTTMRKNFADQRKKRLYVFVAAFLLAVAAPIAYFWDVIYAKILGMIKKK